MNMRFIDVCQAEPLKQAVLFVVLTDSKRKITARKIVMRLRGIDLIIPTDDVLMAIRQLKERGALVHDGYFRDWSIDVGWRNTDGKKKFMQQTYRVRYEGE